MEAPLRLLVRFGVTGSRSQPIEIKSESEASDAKASESEPQVHPTEELSRRYLDLVFLIEFENGQ